MPNRDDYCPVAKSVEILGDRWCLLLVREMLRGVSRFNEFERSLPGISRSILAQRLRHLERNGIIERRVDPDNSSVEYRLTTPGTGLVEVVGALNDWGTRWLVPEGRLNQIDPDGLMAWIRRHVTIDELPKKRVVIRFELRLRKRRRYWLILAPDEVSLCPEHPGFEEDLWITADAGNLYRLFLGQLSIGEAMESGVVEIDGAQTLLRSLPRWFRLRAGESVSA